MMQSTEEEMALAALIGEYDDRGQLGYMLTHMFFAWFEEALPEFAIEGPRGAGRDIELSSIFPDFPKDYPCDFIIRDGTRQVLDMVHRYFPVWPDDTPSPPAPSP